MNTTIMEPSGPMSWFDRVRFIASGLLVCLVRGRLRAFGALVAQSRLETADWTSQRAKGSPWCMWKGKYTERRNGVAGTGEQLAVYQGLGKYWRAWNDRLDWDRRGVNLNESGAAYLESVVREGRWFGTESTDERARTYADACMSRRWAPMAWFDTLGHGLQVFSVAVTVLVLVAILVWLTWLAYRVWKRKKWATL